VLQYPIAGDADVQLTLGSRDLGGGVLAILQLCGVKNLLLNYLNRPMDANLCNA